MTLKIVAARAGVGLLVVAATCGVTSTSARADPVDSGETETVPLSFSGYDRGRSAEAGYDVRTDDQGRQYAVPFGTPEGSRQGATPLFDPTVSLEEQARGSVIGDCGSAYVTFQSKTKFTTGYAINLKFGKPLRHSWNVALTSRIDAGSYNLDGWPPLVGQSWDAGRTFHETALKKEKLTALAGGKVATSFGSCFAGSPTASLTF